MPDSLSALPDSSDETIGVAAVDRRGPVTDDAMLAAVLHLRDRN
ncbi:hypothetical protein OHB41_45475 [Streptomyces sp. NBC_01571]|nr:hypothetical protein [Streptomyces sp. NBC_01571]MCX4580292.1 hypothetical protein [Streptomyces sp. NBC_01571]